MITIALHGASFFAYHGFYPEEQKLGNHFIVDIEVGFEPDVDVNDELTNTVNYEQLHAIAAEQMKQTRKLIETVAQGIINQIKSSYPNLARIQVSIKKLNPQLGSKVDHTRVTINYKKA
jgi:dihydroneopterin aldolase